MLTLACKDEWTTEARNGRAAHVDNLPQAPKCMALNGGACAHDCMRTSLHITACAPQARPSAHSWTAGGRSIRDSWGQRNTQKMEHTGEQTCYWFRMRLLPLHAWQTCAAKHSCTHAYQNLYTLERPVHRKLSCKPASSCT